MGFNGSFLIILTVVIISFFAAGCTETSMSPVTPQVKPLEDNLTKGTEAERPYVTKEMTLFLDSFDADGDGDLTIREAQSFFDWMEENIRFEDDDAVEPCEMVHVGEDRYAPHHIKTPHETWISGSGDDEDMALLAQAFYRHHGYEAKAAWINTTEADRGVCLVKVADDRDRFDQLTIHLGNASPIQLDGRFYLVIDNAYADEYGDHVTGNLTGATIPAE